MYVKRARLLLVAGFFMTGRAEAQRAVDAQLFHPAMDGFGIFSVERSETSAQWDFGLGLYLNYAHAPLRLSLYDEATQAPRLATVMSRAFAIDLGAHLGLTSWLELSVDVPLSVQAYGAAFGHPASAADPDATRTGFYAAEPYTNVGPPDAAPLDSRVAFKARLVRGRGFGLALQALCTLPFGDEAAFLGSNGFSFRPLLIGDYTHHGLRLAINFGAVIRQATTIVDPHDVATLVAAPRVVFELGHELTWSVAIAYRFSRYVGAAATVAGLSPVGVSRTPADHTADVLLGLQLYPGRDLTLSVGGGAGVFPGASRRDLFRTFVGIAWAPSHS